MSGFTGGLSSVGFRLVTVDGDSSKRRFVEGLVKVMSFTLAGVHCKI